MRAGLLLTVVGLALALTACGRASQSDIFAALGITPTPTRSPEEIASATAAAIAQQTAAASASGSPAGGAVAGDVTVGRRIFITWCVNCHVPGGGGSAPDILVADGPASSMTFDEFKAFIRGGEEHPPGPYRTSDFSDRQLGDLWAYIVAESAA